MPRPPSATARPRSGATLHNYALASCPTQPDNPAPLPGRSFHKTLHGLSRIPWQALTQLRSRV